MFELADYLVGIYKVEDCTCSLTIQNCDKQRVLGIGEKEAEKENFDDSLPMSVTPQKQMTPRKSSTSGLGDSLQISLNLSQAPVLNLSQPEPMAVDPAES